MADSTTQAKNNLHASQDATLPTDKQLRMLLAKHPKEKEAKFLGEELVFLPISLDTFFDNFLSDTAKMNMRMFNEQVNKHKDFTPHNLKQSP